VFIASIDLHDDDLAAVSGNMNMLKTDSELVFIPQMCLGVCLYHIMQ
jgi:hypothetical protein